MYEMSCKSTLCQFIECKLYSGFSLITENLFNSATGPILNNFKFTKDFLLLQY